VKLGVDGLGFDELADGVVEERHSQAVLGLGE